MKKNRMKVSMVWAMTAAVALQAAVPSGAGYAATESIIEAKSATPSNSERNETATSSNAIIETPSVLNNTMEGMKKAKASSTGDLWDQWQGDMDFSGLGTKQEPYQISSLAHLMGLSEAVAAGVNFRGKYFEMTQDIYMDDLDVNNGSWNPIGWYQNEEDIGEQVSHGFSGTFDGCGNTIWGLSVHRAGTEADYAGLFGLIDGGCVCNLRIEGAEIYGGDKVGVVAGAVTGKSRIYNVQVSGYVRALKDAGGIAGYADGKGSRVTIENCGAQGIAVLSEGGSGYTGGITGQTINGDLADNVVETQDGSSDRIQGKGYTGGITGRMKQANLYNSYVDGTIGGNGGKAVGGIVGVYESGNLILARFAGDIGRTNNGSASREGTFVGMRQGPFTYGTEKGNNLSYLFTNTAGKAKTVFGSSQDGDNTFTRYAHIGYWTNNETKYTIVAGVTETGCGDRYFYEELEDGVRYIVTQKLEKEFTAEGYAKGLDFKPDHFAPGYQGEPVRGYLLSVPRIDAVNANGTYDTDVASLSALPSGANTYYRTIDKDHCGAVAPGVTVSVATASKNTEGNRYQMAMDSTEPSGVKPPVYRDESGAAVPMTYVNGGTYSFQMPFGDTEINAEYVKVTTQIAAVPSETTISVTQTRTGDRKNPEILTEVRDEAGILIARYINGSQDTSVEIQPVRIHAEHNKAGNTADRTIKWSVDDSDLLLHTSPAGYTMEDARIMPNLEGSFIRGILKRETAKQADSGYEEAISPTIYQRTAVVTASSNPDTSADNQAVYGNCKVTITLQILDQTTRRVERLTLNHANMMCTITRTLKGDRKNPVETITCKDPAVLAAVLSPSQPFYKNVTWKDKESGQILTLSPTGQNQENCGVSLRFDPDGKANPAWIQNVIQTDNQKKQEDPYRKLEGNAVYEETITATAEDQTHGIVSAQCHVTIYFETEDLTEILPEQVKSEPDQKKYELVVTKTGSWRAPILNYEGFEETALKAQILPDCPDGAAYEPYDRTISWVSGEPDILSVTEEGIIRPQKESSWIQELINAVSHQGNRTAEGTKTIQVQALAGAGQTDETEVVLHVTVKDQTVRSTSSGGSSGGGGGSQGSSSGNTSASLSGPGMGGIFTAAGLHVPMAAGPDLTLSEGQGSWIQTADGYWTFQVDGRMCRDQWAYIQNPYADTSKGQNGFDWFRFDEKGHMVTGWFADQDGHSYYLNPVSDNTLGRMMTGWNWISGNDGRLCCYYFQEKSDGRRGALFKDQTTPDGYNVNKEGAWIVENEVQTK